MDKWIQTDSDGFQKVPNLSWVEGETTIDIVLRLSNDSATDCEFANPSRQRVPSGILSAIIERRTMHTLPPNKPTEMYACAMCMRRFETAFV